MAKVTAMLLNFRLSFPNLSKKKKKRSIPAGLNISKKAQREDWHLQNIKQDIVHKVKEVSKVLRGQTISVFWKKWFKTSAQLPF